MVYNMQFLDTDVEMSDLLGRRRCSEMIVIGDTESVVRSKQRDEYNDVASVAAVDLSYILWSLRTAKAAGVTA